VYRCELCTVVVGPGEPLRRHTVYREVPYLRPADDGRGIPVRSTRKEIAREIIVCPSCAAALREGVSVQELSRPRPHAPLEAPRRPNRPVAELVSTVQDKPPTESLSDMIARPRIRERADVVPPKNTPKPTKVRESEQPPKKGKEQPRAMASTPKKPKTKKIPFDNVATEVSVSVYEWSIGGYKWRFSANARGLNLATVAQGEEETATPLVHVKTLDMAAIFAEGFAAGAKSKDYDPNEVERGENEEPEEEEEEDEDEE
jgi:hypothetical protein